MLGLIIGIITAGFAYHKGYNPFLWLLTLGLIGLTAMAFLPKVDPQTLTAKDAEYQRWVGNWWGGGLTILNLVLLAAAFAIKANSALPSR